MCQMATWLTAGAGLLIADKVLAGPVVAGRECVRIEALLGHRDIDEQLPRPVRLAVRVAGRRRGTERRRGLLVVRAQVHGGSYPTKHVPIVSAVHFMCECG